MKPAPLFAIALSFLATTVFGQAHLTVTGEVLDGDSKKPLPHANLAIPGKGLGTMSNTDGRFEFHIPNLNVRDTLAVSYIGYSTYKICISDIQKEQSLTVSLKPINLELAAVVVGIKKYTVHSLLQDVVAHYDSNYNTSPRQMNAFYRETRKEDEKYGYLLEAALVIHQENYKEPYTAELTEVRVNTYDKKFDYSTNENFLRSLLMNDYIASPHSSFYKRYSKKKEYMIEDTAYIDNEPIFVISSGRLPDWKETMYIKASDLAIVRFEGESSYGADGNQEMVKLGKNKVSRYRYLKVINIFRRVNGKYYPGYISMRLDLDNYDKEAMKSSQYKVFEREVMVNDVRPSTGSVAALERQNLETQLKTYNPEFWKNYTILLRTPNQDKIVNDLEQESKLEEQFNNQKPKPLKKVKD